MNTAGQSLNPPVRDNIRAIAVASTLVVGALYTSLITAIHRAISDGRSVSEWCIVGRWLSCDGAFASEYGMFVGLPISAYATGWFVFTLVVFTGTMARQQEEHVVYRSLLFASIPGVLATFVYAVLSLVVLHALCTYCVGVYLLIGLLVTIALPAARMDWSRLRARLAPCITWAIGGAVFLGVISYERRSAVLEIHGSHLLPTRSEASFQLGPLNAPLQITLFSDFECGGCRTGAKEMNVFLARHPREVLLQVVLIPVHRFNEFATGQPVPVSEYLATAVGIAMHKRGRFWEYYKGIFLADRRVDEHLVWEVTGRIIGNDAIPEIRREIDAPEIAETLRRNVTMATRYNIDRTPSYIINGKLTAGIVKSDFLESSLKDAIAMSGSGRPKAPIRRQAYARER